MPRQFGSTVGREVRYSWSYLLQLPQVQNPGIVNYSICIYNRRPFIAPFEFTLPSPTLDLSNNTITYSVTDPTKVKQVLPGQWVLDATFANAGNPDPTVSPLANFYRIVNVRQGTNATQTVLDLQTPIRGYDKVLSKVPPSTVYPPPNVNPAGSPGSSIFKTCSSK